MLAKTPAFLLILGILLLSFSPIMTARGTHFYSSGSKLLINSTPPVYLTFGQDFTFDVDTITYGNGVIDIGIVGAGGSFIVSSVDLTLNSYYMDNWVNYTVSSSGYQQFYNGSKPTLVLIDGTERNEYDGWSCSAGLTMITGATSNASIAMVTTPTPPVSTFTSYSKDSTLQVIGSNISMYFTSGKSIGFQVEEATNLTVTSGLWQTSNTLLHLDRNYGRLEFWNYHNTTLENVMPQNGLMTVQSNSSNRTLSSGESFELVAGDFVIIQWNWVIQIFPLFSLKLGIGIVGLFGLFIVPIYGIHQYRKGDKFKALIAVIVFGAIAFALTVSWLWG